MTLTAEQIVQRMNEAFNCAEAASPEDAAQSILATIRAEATAAAYGAAAKFLLGQAIEKGGTKTPQGRTALYYDRKITALTPADATAWLAADRAAQFKAGQDAALKGAVKGWFAVTDASGKICTVADSEKDARDDAEMVLSMDGKYTIRPCLILVGEGE